MLLTTRGILQAAPTTWKDITTIGGQKLHEREKITFFSYIFLFCHPFFTSNGVSAFYFY